MGNDRRTANRNHGNDHREEGARVARAKDLENTRNSQGGRNAPKAIKDRATGNAAQRRS